MDFEKIWNKIVQHAGSEFRQKLGRIFTYRVVEGNALVPSTTSIQIHKSQFEKAFQRMPVNGPGSLNDLMAPSYLYSVLSDRRITA